MALFRSVLAQMIICGIIALLGPGLWNANNSLGAGGALLPYLVNGGNSLVFGLMGLFCILSPIFVNRIGVKNTLILGTLGWSVYSAALYQNNRFGTEWFVMLGAAICGVSAGLYWAAEGAIVLSYPEHAKRGRYLALWLAFKNSGQLIGGAINLGLNANTSTAGKVSWVTILVFVVLQACALPLSFLLSPPHKTNRADGSKIVVEARTSTSEQLRQLWKTATTKQIGLLLPIFFSSWFYWGYLSSFLTIYFSVRARALASFLSAITGTIACGLFGLFLDSQKLTVKTRIRSGFLLSCGLFTLMWIWVMYIQHEYEFVTKPKGLDWTTPGFGRGFGMYIMLQTIGNMVQNYLYFLVGTMGDGTSELSRGTGLLRGVESWGQCASFGIGSSKFSPFYTTVINVVFWTVSLVPAFFTIWEVQDRKIVEKDVSGESETDGQISEKGVVV
ncbi:major facilitator superfamily domain-containing protein [Podospora aff. communis PSN243]|uniref:Major facilitator superfamily domain-containing protein n=1 Tax=Podospora aff. communis PSN243 TaxID=3040156 RepID=A0AAV9GQA4_9PEZI|nr:major facilitator superfamily domain-containing protein [Podospora aff. communis PSN243]